MLQKSIQKKFEEVPRHLKSSPGEWSDLGKFVVPSPDGDSEAWLTVAIMIILKVRLCGVLSVCSVVLVGRGVVLRGHAAAALLCI